MLCSIQAFACASVVPSNSQTELNSLTLHPVHHSVSRPCSSAAVVVVAVPEILHHRLASVHVVQLVVDPFPLQIQLELELATPTTTMIPPK